MKKNKIKTWNISFIITVVLLLGAGYVNATVYYVSPNGTATWPNCTTPGNPCEASNTVKDFLNAEAGDTVYFLDGTYSGLTVPYTIYIKTPSWYAVNSGTAENPIVFKALNRRQVILEGLGNSTAPISNEIVPLIGGLEGSGDNYVIWDGFVLRAVRADGTTPAMARVSMYDCNHITINDCEIIGVEHNNGGEQNWDGVRFEGADYITVTNCDIHGWKETSHNHNTSGTKCYNSYYATIRNNNFYDNYTHVYIKGNGNGNFSVFNNYFVDGDDGILNSVGYAENNHAYYNNVFNRVDKVLNDGGVGAGTAANPDFHNNTIYAPDADGDASILVFPESPDGANAIFYNNIIINGTKRPFDTRATGRYFQQADHNLCYPDFNPGIGIWSSTTFYSSLSEWKASESLYENYDAGCGSNKNPGCGSLNVDPLFVNSSGTFSELSDFALSVGSPAKGAGREGVDMGADISLVGVQVEGTVSIESNQVPAVTYADNIRTSIANNHIHVNFNQPANGNGTVTLFGINGRKLMSVPFSKGQNAVALNVNKKTASSLYLVEVKTSTERMLNKVVLLNR